MFLTVDRDCALHYIALFTIDCAFEMFIFYTSVNAVCLKGLAHKVFSKSKRTALAFSILSAVVEGQVAVCSSANPLLAILALERAEYNLRSIKKTNE